MKKLIDWFADNSVAANLLMVLIIAGGLSQLWVINREVFPTVTPNTITISANYPGAGPEEVERQVVVRLEEAIDGLEGIENIRSSAKQNSAQVTVEIIKGYDQQRLLSEIKNRVDGLSTLPTDVEKIQTTAEINQLALMSIAVYGTASESQLKDAVNWIGDELSLLPEVSTVAISGIRDDEISISIKESTFKQYGLSFDIITQAVRAYSVDLPAGEIKTAAGDLQIQTRGQGKTAKDFANIPIITESQGGIVRLGDIAEVADGFAEVDTFNEFNDKPASYIEVFAAKPPDILASAASAREKLAELQTLLPENIQASVWRDWSVIFKSRMNLLLKNAFSGLVLVFIILMIFLRPSLAAWVCLGIVIAFLGAFWLLPMLGVSINMLSMFGFLLVLGIVVDDAIIVGESIYSAQENMSPDAGAKHGALAVTRPVLFAVLSTILFFSGIFGLPGAWGDITYPIPVIVISCLIFSLVECLLILPSHLSTRRHADNTKEPSKFDQFRYYFANKLIWFARNPFKRLLHFSLKYNTQTILVFISGFLIVACLFSFGHVKSRFTPEVPSNSIRISATLPESASFSESLRIQNQLVSAANQVKQDTDLLSINNQQPFVRAIRSSANGSQVNVTLALLPTEEREVSIVDAKNRWSDLIGDVKGVKDFSLSFTINSVSKAIGFNVSVANNDSELLAKAIDDVKSTLASYSDIERVESSLDGNKTDLNITLKKEAIALGVNLETIAKQVRQAFYGQEVQRIARNREDVRVMLRLPIESRQSINNLRNMEINVDGKFIPLSTLAVVKQTPGFSEIQRENRRRSIAVSADISNSVDAKLLTDTILQEHLTRWQQQYLGFALDLAGGIKDQNDFNRQILFNMAMAILASFALMAAAFRSYIRPLLILTAIPFGFMGGILGHWLTGNVISMLSLLGLLACAGVVVNDNLVLLDRIDQLKNSVVNIIDRLVQAAIDRFRAIVLTSLTTFIGLAPIMFETSVQAQFLIPMVVSLSFGVLFATVVTLLLVPNLFLAGHRFHLRFSKNRR